MHRKRILNGLFKIVNFFTPKIRDSIYINVGISSKNNYEDLINNNGNNVLKFIASFIDKSYKTKIFIFLEYFDSNRLVLYENVKKRALENNIYIKFVKDYADQKGIKKFISLCHKYHCIFRSKILIVGTGDTYLFGKLKKQFLLNLNYFISCKNDLIIGDNYRWKHIDGMLTTSMLGSTIISSQTGVRLDYCWELGFPRNDTLFSDSKKTIILEWIKSKIGFYPEKIIVYAPTYRDYEKNCDFCFSRSLFGYEIDGLEKFLLDNKTCMISKLHNLTLKTTIDLPKGVIPFKLCYDFSFYDLLAVTDCLITDYSSVGYDFLLLNRPIIYNLYDIDKYIMDRGLSYEPYDDFCPGQIVKNADEMINALNDFIKGNDVYKKKRSILLKIFHKYPDGFSSDRVINYFCDKFRLKKDD